MEKSPVCFALDFPTLGHALDFFRKNDLKEHVGAVKVGLELFIASGPVAVSSFRNEVGIDVVLDLKLHDIPETVARAVKAGGDLGVKYMTLHIQQRSALEAAVKAAGPYGIQLLGVTVLTSMASYDCDDLGYAGFSHVADAEDNSPVGDRVLKMAQFGRSCGLSGFVCSPNEAARVRDEAVASGYDPFLLVPGIRPAGANIGDQKRVGTPLQAVRDGASLIVVGRPIRDAEYPEEAAKDIVREIRGNFP